MEARRALRIFTSDAERSSSSVSPVGERSFRDRAHFPAQIGFEQMCAAVNGMHRLPRPAISRMPL
jgi:hypothetical protein